MDSDTFFLRVILFELYLAWFMFYSHYWLTSKFSLSLFLSLTLGHLHAIPAPIPTPSNVQPHICSTLLPRPTFNPLQVQPNVAIQGENMQCIRYWLTSKFSLSLFLSLTSTSSAVIPYSSPRIGSTRWLFTLIRSEAGPPALQKYLITYEWFWFYRYSGPSLNRTRLNRIFA